MKEKTKKRIKKVLWFILTIAVLVVVAWGGLSWHQGKQEEKAKKALKDIPTLRFEDSSREEKLESIKEYKKVYKKYPKTAAGNTALFDAGRTYMDLEEYEKAIECFKSCTFKDKVGAQELEQVIGDAYSSLKKPQEALKHYKKVIDSGKGSYGRYACLQKIVEAYQELGEEKNELKYLEVLFRESSNRAGGIKKKYELRKESLKRKLGISS